MEKRWVAIGFTVLFTGLTIALFLRGSLLQAAIGGLHTVAALGAYWSVTHTDDGPTTE